MTQSKYDNIGYSNWSIRRTISEAENVARWNPWLAHEWMEEALNQLSLDNPFYSEYNNAVDRINYRWELLKKFEWFNEGEFWQNSAKDPGITKLLDKI